MTSTPPLQEARWAFHGPPWAVALEPLCTRPWATADEARALAKPLGELVGRLARHADAAFPTDLPPPLELPPEGRGLAWNALISGDTERELKIEAIGVAGQVILRLSVLLPEKTLTLETSAGGRVLAAMERDVEAMLGDRGRKKRKSSPPVVRKAVKSSLPALHLGGSVAALAIAVAVTVAGAGFLRDSARELSRWWRLDTFAAVEGTVVGVRAVVAPEEWSKSRTAQGDVIPELDVAYEFRGSRHMSFVDPELRRATPGVARALAERTWVGRKVTVHVDPKAPDLALEKRELPVFSPLLRLLLGLVLAVPGAMLAVGVIVDAVWTIRAWRRAVRAEQVAEVAGDGAAG